MGMHSTTTNTPRIGLYKGEVLAHAQAVECLGITGQNKKFPKNNSLTVKFVRWLPYGATTTNQNTINRPSVTVTSHQVAEGITPAPESLTPQYVTVVLQQYGVLYGTTDQVVDTYEDDIPKEMRTQVGERMGLLREMIRYGQLKGATNAFYAGGTSRSTVSQVLSFNLLSKISRNLMLNRARPIREILDASPNFNTASVEAAFLVFCSTDCEHDIRSMDGFVHVSEYGQRKVVHDMELGSVGRYRFVISPELSQYADSGATVASTGLASTTGTNIDVYPCIIVGMDAWGDVALRGMDSFKLYWKAPDDSDSGDPLGQRGYLGAKLYAAAGLFNQGWMAVAEVGVTNL